MMDMFAGNQKTKMKYFTKFLDQKTELLAYAENLNAPFFGRHI